MNPLEIIKTIADFGFIVVAAGFIMWQVYNFVSNQNAEEKNNIKRRNKRIEKEEKIDDLKEKRYEAMLDDIQAKQNSFYDILMETQKQSEERYNKMLDEIIEILKKPHVLSTEENNRMTKIDEEIDLILEKALAITKASRVALIKFHNGGNDMLGNSILKMSMSNEKCAAGVIHIINNFQNQLRSSFAYWIKELGERGSCSIEDVEEVRELDNSIYQYMKQCGVEAKYGIAIRNISTGSVIGYLCIDFLNKDNVDIDQVHQCLNDKKNRIEALLNL